MSESSMFGIGEFSRITGLTVKTLRFYHEQGVLMPSRIDHQTGYRYYGENKIETARIIALLRKLEFPLNDVVEILRDHDDEADILAFLERHRQAIEEKMQHFGGILTSLDQVISKEQEARTVMESTNFEIEEKNVDTVLIAGFRMRGKYSDCGQGFGKIGKAFGRHICGKPMLLIYDAEYKEDDADFEPCMPIRKGSEKSDISVRELAGCRCVTLLHKGPYDELHRSYERLIKHVKDQGYATKAPCREVYVKGPGMIFKGNPRNYLTEIQMPLAN